MAYTSIANLYIPDVWESATREASTKVVALLNSPAVARAQMIDALIAPSGLGGETINLPHFKPVTVAARVQTNATAVPVDNVSAAVQVGVVRNREFALGSESLAAALSGADPVAFITASLGETEVINKQADLISMLRGVFGAALAGLVKNIANEEGTAATAANKIDAETVLDAMQLLGDHKKQLAIVLMHSQIETNLLKQDLIDYAKDSQSETVYTLYMGKRVFVDDDLSRAGTTDGTVYETYFASVGAIVHGVAAPDFDNPIGVNRVTVAIDELKNIMAVIRRYRYLLHVRGTKWKGVAAAKGGPTDAELATAANWENTYELKNIGLVQVLSNG